MRQVLGARGGFLCSCGVPGLFLDRGSEGGKSVVLTWNLKFSLSLEELGVCYNEFLSLLRGKLLAGDSYSIQNCLGRTVWVQSRSYHEVRSRGRVEGRGKLQLTSTSRTVTPGMIADM